MKIITKQFIVKQKHINVESGLNKVVNWLETSLVAFSLKLHEINYTVGQIQFLNLNYN